jgi:NAD(P)H dehydrogenase (quinone)
MHSVMKILMVVCHPVPTSFTHAVAHAALLGFTRSGHDVHSLDLYAMGFDPVLSALERERYLTDPASNVALVKDHVELLTTCEALVVVYPTWYYGPPAMLKGWLERVWLPGVTFTLPRVKGDRARGTLNNIRHFVGLTTSGSPWWWLRLVRDPGRNLFMRALRAVFAPRCQSTWLQLHNMNNLTPEERRRHLARVEQVCSRLR